MGTGICGLREALPAPEGQQGGFLLGDSEGPRPGSVRWSHDGLLGVGGPESEPPPLVRTRVIGLGLILTQHDLMVT